jgi:membrane protease YdiL (CAAX protease family)
VEIQVLFLLTNLAAWTVADAIFRGGTAHASRLVPTRTIGREVMWGAAFTVLALSTISFAAIGMGASFTWRASLLLVVMAAPQSIVEELFFRGVIFDAIRGRWGDVSAISITSLFFAFAHGYNPNVSPLALINVGLAGVLLGVLVVRTGSLWPSMVFHLTWNGILSGVLLAPVSGIGDASDSTLNLVPVMSQYPQLGPLLFGGGFGLEEGLLTTILLSLATLAALKWVRISPYVNAAVLRMKYLRSTS